MNKIVFITMLLLPVYAFTRTISGTVKDEQNNPIVFANVVVLDKDSTFLEGVVTDSFGVFHFCELPESSAIIKISCIGYEDYIFTIPDKKDLGTITMKASSSMLDEVVIEAELPKTRVSGNTLITTVANSILADAGTANDVLAKTPLVTGSDGKFSDFGAGTPVIYINGRIVRNNAELAQLSSKEIKSVEVTANPGAKYDAEANAVIKIKTLPPKGEGFSTSVYNSTRIASFAMNSNNLLIKYRHGGFEIFGQGYFRGGKRRSHELGSMTTYNSSNSLFIQELDSYTTTSSVDGSGKIGFNFQQGEKHSFGAYYKIARYKDKSSGLLDTKIKSSRRLCRELHQRQHGIELEQPAHEANVYYNGSIGKLSIDFNGDFVQTNKNIDDIQNEQIRAAESRTVYTYADNRNSLFAEKLVVAHPLWNGKIEVGEECTNSHVSYQSHYTGAGLSGGETKIRESNVAAFTQISQQFGTFRVGLGLRFEHVSNIYFGGDSKSSNISRTYNNLFPSFSLSCRINKVGLSFDLTSRTRRPFYRQLDGTLRYVNRYSYRIGNPALRPVERYTVQIMAQWNDFFAQVAYNYEKNSIIYATERYNGDPLVKLIVFENVPKHQQFQFLIGTRSTIGCWSPLITLGLFNSFYKTQFLSKEKRFDRPFLIVNWDNSLSLPKNWVFDIDCMAQTAGNAQNCYIKASSYLNLSVKKSLFNNALTVQLKANDIFNTNNERIIMYNGDIIVSSYNYQESRNLVFSLRYNFNTSRSKYRGTGAGLEEKSRL